MDLNGRLIREKAREYPDEAGHYKSEEKMLDILPNAFAEGSWERDDLEYIVEWKSGRFGGTNIESFNENSDRKVREAIDGALEANSVVRKLDCLTKLIGVRVRMATALLLFMDPQGYTVLDTKAWERLLASGHLQVELSTDPTAGEYLRYLGVCHSLAEELDVELRTLDRALWVLGEA